MRRMISAVAIMACLLGWSLSGVLSGDKKEPPEKKPNPVFTNDKEAGDDFLIQGEYVGKHGDEKVAAQVIARGDGKFVINFLRGGLPGDGWDGKSKMTVEAKTENGKVIVDDKGFTGEFKDGKLTVNKDGDGAVGERIIRKSPTLGAKPPTGAVVLLDGKSLDSWTKGDGKTPAHWKLQDDGSIQAQRGGDILSKAKFKDFTLHIEFQLPFMPKDSGQDRANSGVYLQNRYEIQVLDSFGLKGLNNECGGIYSQSAPKVNMCFPPLSWQTYDIDFTAARFDDDKRSRPAFVTVRHNGVVIHEDQELKGPSGGGDAETVATGSFRLQDHGNPVRYRNIWVVEKK